MKARVSLTRYDTAVVDCETDPFKQGRVPYPFVIGFYHDSNYEQFWGPDCVDQFFRYLEASEKSFLIYAHNGGKFDFHFFFDWLENPIIVINGRITQASTFVTNKVAKHILQDSYAILPFPLEAYRKTEIDYAIFEPHEREKPANKKKISDYLYDDCRDLYALVRDYSDTFGFQLTVGSNAMKQLRQHHSFERCDPRRDAHYRKWYYGGRVQCFETGVLKGPFRILDINSAYPFVMQNSPHPFNGNFEVTDDLPDTFERPFFAKITGRNYGALPVRTQDGLSFSSETGTYDPEAGCNVFHVCSHELQVALKYDLFKIDKVISCEVACEVGNFSDFVNHFYDLRQKCKAGGDKIGELKYKYVLNSAYGKFAQNPENYYDWMIVRDHDNYVDLEASGWELYNKFPQFEIHRRKADFNRTAYYDVAIAASITSATRALLLEGIQQAVRPVYCDTDSLVCQSFNGNINASELGAWKDEGTCDMALIAGKKLYSLCDHLPNKTEIKSVAKLSGNMRARRAYEKTRGVVKVVSKGGNLSWPEIAELCAGGSVDYANPVPAFRLQSAPKFINRRFNATFDKGRKTG